MSTTESRKIRALMIGAHPDDCEYWTGGIALKLRRQGHVVKYVSVSNGSAGHHEMGPVELALRRLEETRMVTDATGIEYEVFDLADGKLTADLTTRERIIRLIRTFNADIVFTHRPNDYHPDHRAVGTLVMDASYLVQVPLICPETPALARAPLILQMNDRFQKPVPFTPEIVISIDEVIGEKANMLHLHESQFYEWLPYVGGYSNLLPTNVADRIGWLRERLQERDSEVANRFRSRLIERYGGAEGNKVSYAEAFELSEYGRPLAAREMEEWFLK